jgi:hypothetical protein
MTCSEDWYSVATPKMTLWILEILSGTKDNWKFWKMT